MAGAVDGWAPANEVERRLSRALADDDGDRYLRTLNTAPLFLPGFVAAAGGPQRALTRVRDGVTYLAAFTSVDALTAATGGRADGWRVTHLAELVGGALDPAWGVVLVPVGLYLGPDRLREVAAAADAAFRPADDRERLLQAALRAAQPHDFLDILVITRVLVPAPEGATAAEVGPDFRWRTETLDGRPVIPVFTSPQRLAEAYAEPVPAVAVDLLTVVRAWPDPGVALAVNPGSAIAVTFAGAQVADLVGWARGLMEREARRRSATAAPPAPVGGAQSAIADVLRGLGP